MGYRNCPNCRSMNRDTDSKCFSCEQDLDAAPPPGPGGESSGPIGGGLTKATSARIKDRDSNVFDGLRSGALAGVCIGSLIGLYGAFFGSMLASMFTQNLGGIGMAGAVIFIITLISEVIYTTIVGGILGGMNILCYQSDSSKVGWWIGVGMGFLRLALGGGVFGILYSGGHGALVGVLASFFEKRKRGQYAEI